MKLCVLLLLLFSCRRDNGVLEVETEANAGVSRFENSEVVCYKLYDKALQCKWKDTK